MVDEVNPKDLRTSSEILICNRNMRFDQIILGIYSLLCITPLFSQNTVGTLSLDSELSYAGYNIIYPHNQSNVYLINTCGDVMHMWEDDEDFRPSNVAYLQENGNLLKTKRAAVSTTAPIWAGGGGAIVEIRDWDNILLQSFELNDENDRLHHDIVGTPEGTILMIAWESKSNEEAIMAGRNPALISNGILWPDYILEWDPDMDSIIWEWHVWDHLIQDYDSTKNNFGVVSNHPELVEINYDEHDGHQDWLHSNSLHYNSFLDQILLSIPYFNEIWIIDHSTTSQEAASHQGGASGKGGDLLYRWGNPQAFRAGTIDDKQLFFQHGAKWVDPSAELDSENYGLISLFNNRVSENYSSLNVINAEFDMYDNQYRNSGGRFLPNDFEIDVVHPDTLEISSSSGLSSVQMLPNGNLLAVAGRWGYAYELTPNNEVVWEYRTPLRGGTRIEQGSDLNINNNLTFRIDRYSLNFPGFDNKELSPGPRLEINPSSSICDVVTATEEISISKQMTLLQNPVSHLLRLNVEQGGEIQLINLSGQIQKRVQTTKGDNEIDVSDIPNGAHLLRHQFGEAIIVIKVE